MRMISLAVNYDSFFIRCQSDTAAFAPDLRLGVCVFALWYLHCSSRFRLAYPVAFESARRRCRCNPPDAYSCPSGRSTQVFRPTEIRVFPLLRCLLHYGRWRTKWASDTSGSERRDTIEYRSWAIGKYSNESHFHQKCQSFRTLNSGMHSDTNVGRVLIQP